MSSPHLPALQTRIDDYSYQVSVATDPRFWFRLERQSNRDVITDFFLGSFPEEKAAGLLAECYRVLGLTPRMTVMFRDIAPSCQRGTDGEPRAEAHNLYAGCGKALLTAFGATRVQECLEEEDGKYHVVLVGEC